MNVSDLPELATPVEISKVLRCTPKFVQMEMAAGKLRASKIAGRYLATQQAVRDYIEGNIVACQDPIPARDEYGEKTATNGKSFGTSEENAGTKRQVQAMLTMLKGNSSNSSKIDKQPANFTPARVTPIR